MSWNLPISVEIDGTEYPIRNKCDYRVVLDVIKALNDEDLDMQYRIQCALFIFYGNDELDTKYGNLAYDYNEEHPNESSIHIELELKAIQKSL